MLLSCAVPLCSCSDEPPTGNKPPKVDPTPSPEGEQLIIPDLFEHGRRTVNFDNIIYARPDVDTMISDIRAVTDTISSGEGDFDALTAKITRIDSEYENFSTMYSYSHLMMTRDTSSEYWCAENAHLAERSPALIKAVEDMLVAAATSSDAERYESDVFGEGLREKYSDGGIYTDKAVSLMEKEAELESFYSSLSTANVTITYKTITDTYDNIISFFAEHYGTESESYRTAVAECGALFNQEYRRICRETMLSLVKVRRKLANELKLSSYLDYAYENIYHDYVQKQLIEYAADVSRYVVPVFFELEYSVFARYFYTCHFKNEVPVAPGKNELMNDFYSALGEMDGTLCNIYSYMLTNGLYDVAPSALNRFDGAYTTYLDAYDAPYVFISTEGSCSDYTTLAHEFGHFVDSYINYDSSTSLDLSEVSSQGLELLTLLALEDDISDEAYKYLTYLEIRDALCAIIYQTFYALFEHYAYSIPYNELSEEALVGAVSQAAEDMGLTKERSLYLFGTESPDSLDYVLMTHTIIYPAYVQSYATSAAVALEIYCMELSDEGGLEAYLSLIDRGEDGLTFTEQLAKAGLGSPFEDEYLVELMNDIHYSVRGEYYFKENDKSDAA